MHKKRKITLEDEINNFFKMWTGNDIIEFLRSTIPLFELYDVEDEDDWVEKEVGGDEENVRNVRLIRTVYLISKIAETHAAKLCKINFHFKHLWKRMEKQSMETKK